MKNRSPNTPYPKARLDALTDGVFAVAMTLLVLDLRLPEGLHPGDSAQMLGALLNLWPSFLPYCISFMILGLRWLSLAQVCTRAEHLAGAYIHWWLMYLLLITCVPFVTTVVGRYADYAPSIWLYSGLTALISIASWRMTELTPDIESQALLHQRRVSMAFLFVSSLLCIALSLVLPKLALLAFLLNLATPSVGKQRPGA